MPNIRPNCPPPKRPIVEPGGISVFMHSNLKRSGTHGKNSRSEEFRSQESGVRSQESGVKESRSYRSSGVTGVQESRGKYRWARTNTGVEHIAHRMEADE